MKKLLSITEIRHINLRGVMDRDGVTTTQLARLLDKEVSQVSQFASPKKHKGIGDEMARLIEEKLGLAYYTLDSAQRAMSDLNEPQSTYASDARVVAIPRKKIPVVGVTAAGEAIEIIDLHQPGVAEEWVDAYGNPGPSTFALKLDGFSMEKKFASGDIVQIEPDLEWKANDFVFAKRRSDNHGTFKQLKTDEGSYYLYALNEDFKPRYIELNEDWVIVGKATWKLERL